MLRNKVLFFEFYVITAEYISNKMLANTETQPQYDRPQLNRKARISSDCAGFQNQRDLSQPSGQRRQIQNQSLPVDRLHKYPVEYGNKGRLTIQVSLCDCEGEEGWSTQEVEVCRGYQ